MRETACSLCDGLWICVDVGGLMCACVLKPQAMKVCACLCVSVRVCVCARLIMCMRLHVYGSVRACSGGRKSVGECRRQTCQFHSWFLWLQGSGRSRVTLSITAPQHRAWGKHTIIYCRGKHIHTYTYLGWLPSPIRPRDQ